MERRLAPRLPRPVLISHAMQIRAPQSPHFNRSLQALGTPSGQSGGAKGWALCFPLAGQRQNLRFSPAMRGVRESLKLLARSRAALSAAGATAVAAAAPPATPAAVQLELAALRRWLHSDGSFPSACTQQLRQQQHQQRLWQRQAADLLGRRLLSGKPRSRKELYEGVSKKNAEQRWYIVSGAVRVEDGGMRGTRPRDGTGAGWLPCVAGRTKKELPWATLSWCPPLPAMPRSWQQLLPWSAQHMRRCPCTACSARWAGGWVGPVLRAPTRLQHMFAQRGACLGGGGRAGPAPPLLLPAPPCSPTACPPRSGHRVWRHRD